MPVDKNITEIAIASLLHDIGKIYERTNKKIEPKDELFRYSHASYTSEFFNEWNGLSTPGIDTGKIEAIASYHHNPNDDISHFIVQQADRYSAGADRRDKDENEYISTGKSNRPLVSIFSQLKLDKNNFQTSDQANHYSLDGENGLEIGFPSKENTVSEYAYQQLYENLKNDLNKLYKCNYKLIVDNLISICRKHMSLVTSSARLAERSDITLFDHSLTTAAISCAMYGWHSENNQFDTSQIQNNTIDKFLLFKVDLSGIQDFILDLPKQNQKGIAKILRARSSYLSILMSGLSKLLLEKLGLPSTNCLLNAGGNFTILAQNTHRTKKLISEFQNDLERWMLDTFNGNLHVNISEPIEFCGSDFSEQDNFKKLSLHLSEEVDKSKKQRLKSVLQSNGKWDEDVQILKIEYNEQGSNLLNEKMINLGKKLAYADYIIFSENKGKSPSNAFRIMEHLDIEVTRTAELDDNTLMAFAVNKSNYDDVGFALTSLANYVPKIKANDHLEEDSDEMAVGQVLPFNYMADKSEGKKALAVLKADVDRLGLLFSNGLQEKNHTISRIATLSRMLDGFFSSYLNVLLENQYPYIYTEYAGGDDLLLIGPWDQVLEFAIDLHKKFKEYTCDNPDINISAGISLMHVGEPVTNALRQAEKLLDTSKESAEKNKISLFDTTLEWDTYSKAIKQGKWLKANITKNTEEKLNRGFVYRLLQYYFMKQRVEQLDKNRIPLNDAKWHSQLSYDMSRNVKNIDVRQEIEEMFSGTNIDNVKVATTYCLYSLRN